MFKYIHILTLMAQKVPTGMDQMCLLFSLIIKIAEDAGIFIHQVMRGHKTELTTDHIQTITFTAIEMAWLSIVKRNSPQVKLLALF